jgi:hypothetical protein
MRRRGPAKMSKSTLRALSALSAVALLLIVGYPQLRHLLRRRCPDHKVLFVGNSLTYVNDLPSTLAELSWSKPGRCVEVDSVVAAGATLGDHWTRAAARERIRSEPWHAVVLQDQSLRPLEAPAETLRDIRLFHAEIAAQKAHTLLFSTWTRRDAPERQLVIGHVYATSARELSARVVPVGEAWRLVRSSHPQIELYAPDGNHPARAGTYLTACVFYATLFSETPEGASRLGLDQREASALQRAAWQIVSELGRARPRSHQLAD